MVESMQDNQDGVFDAKLEKDWGDLAKKQLNVAAFLKDSVKRTLDDGTFVAFFNNKLVSDFYEMNFVQDINRFFVAEGTGDNMPKVEFGGCGAGDDEQDPFEDSLEDALCVFKSGAGAGKDADILKENEGQILFYVDLENEQIIDKNVAKKAQD